jgi:hypothetical protein
MIGDKLVYGIQEQKQINTGEIVRKNEEYKIMVKEKEGRQ